jgi:hypothetical protein
MALGRVYGGYVLLGCVVRGETDHYDFICDAVCHGVMAISAETGVPLGFGLLTVDNLDQAIARSRDDRMNKGAEAAHAMLGQSPSGGASRHERADSRPPAAGRAPARGSPPCRRCSSPSRPARTRKS